MVFWLKNHKQNVNFFLTDASSPSSKKMWKKNPKWCNDHRTLKKIEKENFFSSTELEL